MSQFRKQSAPEDSANTFSVSDLIEHIGFGRAQLQLAALAPFGTSFSNGTNLVSISLTSSAIGHTFGLSHGQQAFLVTSCLLGVMAGNLSSGYVGDTFGRRIVVLVGYAMTFGSGLCCAGASGPIRLFFFRTLLGFSMGIGIPPAVVALSENTPQRWRMWMRGATTMACEAGGVYIAMSAALMHAPMDKLDWRRLTMIACAPSLVMFILALVFLHESPVYLACTGRRERAELGFEAMCVKNSRANVNVCYDEPDIPTKILSLREQLDVIYSPKLRSVSIVAMMALLFVNMVLYGDMYAVMQVFPKDGALPPAVQMTMKQVTNCCWCLVCTSIADSMSRKVGICGSLSIAVMACYAFAIGGLAPSPRSVLFETLFQSGTCLVGLACGLGQMVLFQFSAEIYPPQAASAGSAAIIGAARIGCVVAPLLFEFLRDFTHSWCTFHLVVGTCCAAVCVAVSLVPQVRPYHVGGQGLAKVA